MKINKQAIYNFFSDLEIGVEPNIITEYKINYFDLLYNNEWMFGDSCNDYDDVIDIVEKTLKKHPEAKQFELWVITDNQITTGVYLDNFIEGSIEDLTLDDEV